MPFQQRGWERRILSLREREMSLHIPITEDLASVLDGVLGKSIVVDSWIQMGLPGAEFRVVDATARVASSAVHVSRDRGRKAATSTNCSRSGGATCGPNK